MHRVLLCAAASAIALVIGGCRDRQVEQLEAVRKTVCACKDVACGEAALANVPKDDIESNHRTQQVARGMLDCLAKLYEDQQPKTDPDDEPGDGSGSGIAGSGIAGSGNGNAGSGSAGGGSGGGRSGSASGPGSAAGASATTH